MDYITLGQFWKADKDVQEEMIRWWDNRGFNKLYDLVEIISGYGEEELVNQIMVCKDTTKNLKYVPLMNETLLRKFIEYKTNSIIEILYIVNKGYSIRCSRKNVEDSNKTFSKLGDDLLQAYWEVACICAKSGCKVAKGAI